MLILGIDFETTGLVPGQHRAIEVGAVLWDAGRHAPVVCYSAFLRHEPLPEVTPEIAALTGITQADLRDHGVPPQLALATIADMAVKAAAYCAHNAPFDAAFHRAEAAAYGAAVVERPWIDTLVDVPWPVTTTSRRLGHLAADHGLLNGFGHRALFDVLTMCQLLSKYDIAAVVESASSPALTLRALVQYADNHKAKALGYRWDGEKKQWLKNTKQVRLQKELEAAEAIGCRVAQV